MKARYLVAIVALFLLMPMLLIGLYHARSGAGPRPLVMSAPAQYVPDSVNGGPTRWVQDASDAASPRTPHSSMRTLTAFVAERAANAVGEVGGDAGSVGVSGDDQARNQTEAVRYRLETQRRGPVNSVRSQTQGPHGERAAVSAAEPPPGDFPVGLPPVEPGNAGLPEPVPVRPPSPSDVTGQPVPAPSPDVTEQVVPVPSADVTASPAQGQTTVTLAWRDFREAGVPVVADPVRRGTLRVDIDGPRGTAAFVAELDEKPWLETEPAAVGLSGYAVVSTQAPSATSEDAQATARALTVEALMAQVDMRVRAMPGLSSASREDLRRQAEWAIAAGNVLDRALVRVDRSYGPVWYAADLVDTRVEVIGPLAAVAAQSQVVRTRTVVGTIIALPGMLLVLGAVYLGLNALTRGYFRTHLRAGLAAAVAVAVVALLVVAGFVG